MDSIRLQTAAAYSTVAFFRDKMNCYDESLLLEMQGIFLDRDGVINIERSDYVKSWQEFTFLPNVLNALAELATLNLPTFIITNQSAIGRKIISQADVELIHRKMLLEITSVGLKIEQIFICPHHPEEKCTCRKPAPGMLIQAAKSYHLDIAQCIFIGDSITDYQAALNCGCQSILVRSGRQGQKLEQLLSDTNKKSGRDARSVIPLVDDLSAAVRQIACLQP